MSWLFDKNNQQKCSQIAFAMNDLFWHFSMQPYSTENHAHQWPNFLATNYSGNLISKLNLFVINFIGWVTNGLNNVLVRYSRHDLKSEPKVYYSSHQCHWKVRLSCLRFYLSCVKLCPAVVSCSPVRWVGFFARCGLPVTIQQIRPHLT